MQPLDQSQPLPALPQTATQPREAGLLGRIGARFGGWAIGWAAKRDAPALDGRAIQIKNASCGKLISDISNTMTQIILKKADSAFVSGGREEIRQAMEDLLNHVFSTLATEELGEEELTDDELADHFFTSILKKVIKEFEKPDIDTKQHFKNIADELLKKAFPEGVEDKKIPILLRKLLGGNALLQWVAQKKLETDQDLSWEGMTNLFAEHLEGIYTSLTKSAENGPNEQVAPGVTTLIQAIIKKIDTSTKETTSIPLQISQLNDESNTFVTKFLTRLLQGQFTRNEDAELLTKARGWLLTHMQTSLQAVYTTIFACRPGQTADERRTEFADNLTSQACKILPQTRQRIKDIDDMDVDAVKMQLLAWVEDPSRSFHQAQIEQTITTLNEREQSHSEAKELLKSITAFLSIERILAQELNPEKLQPLLPPFLSAKTVFDQIYSFTSPYLVEIITQSNDIQTKGQEATLALNTQGADEITGWIDSALKMARGLLETKAEAHTLTPTGFTFIDDLIAYAVKPGVLPSGTETKAYIDSQLKNIIVIIIKQAVESQENGLAQPEKAIADLIDSILTKGQEATLALIEAKKTSPEEKRTQSLHLAQELGITLKPDALNDAMSNSTFEMLFMTKASRTILESIITKELFNSLLPKFLRKNDLFEGVADLLCSYLKGLSLQTEKINGYANAQELTLQVPQLKTMLTSLTQKVVANLKAQPQRAVGSSFNKLKVHLLQGKGLQNLVENALPKIVEAFIAYHVNPKDGLTSEKRTAQFFMQIVTKAQIGFDKVDAYAAAPDKTAWLEEHGYIEAVLSEYRKKHDLPPSQHIDISSFLLHEASEHLVSSLLPKELLHKLIPEEFAIFKVDELLAKLCYDYIEDAYNYADTMKQLATEHDSSQAEALTDLQKYLETQIQDYFHGQVNEEQTWIEEVTKQIFTLDNPEQKTLLLKFTTNIYFGAIGFVLKNAEGSEISNNLLNTFAPIARNAQKMFLILNSTDADANKLSQLKITPDDITDYLQATGKENYEIDHLAYWIAARTALENIFPGDEWDKRIPDFLRTVLTKETAANFATKAYEAVHATQTVLQKSAEQGSNAVKQKDGLEAFFKKYFFENIKELLRDIAKEGKPISPMLPAIADSFIKECFKDDTTSVGEIRDTVIQRLLDSIAAKLLTDDTPIIKKAQDLIACYKKGDNANTAALLLEVAVPKEVLETPIGSAAVSKIALKELTDCIGQIKKSEDTIVKEAREAKKYLYSLDGMKPFVKDIIDGLDNSLVKIAKGDEKLSNDFPEYIDTLLKTALLDETLSPTIKTALHNVVYIILQEVLTPKLGQSIENRVLEVGAELVSLYNAPDSQKTGTEWLKLLIPKERLKELLPEFLQNAITHDKLVKWFFVPYVEQVNTLQQNVVKENSIAPSNNVTRAQGYVQNLLLGYTKPTATKHGLLGFEGVVRELERSLLSTLIKDKDPNITPATQAYLKAAVGQITRTLEGDGILEPQFLAEALVTALPSLDKLPEDMPSNEDFPQMATEALLKKIFPNGKVDLPVPDVAKELVWEKATKAMQDFFIEITTPEKRLLWATDRLIGLTTDNEELIGKRLQEVENMRQEMKAGTFNPKIAEARFKRYTLEAAVRQVELKIQEEKLWGPLKWIKTQVAKAVTYLATRFSLRNRIYTFVADSSSDAKIRQFLWTFLTFTPPNPQRQRKELEEELRKRLKDSMATTSVAPRVMQNFLASQAASYLVDKNALDILC